MATIAEDDAGDLDFVSDVQENAQANNETLLAAGIRTLTSKHLTLYTDLPSSPDVDELPDVFDAAVPQWAKFFRVDAKQLDSWRVTACVIQNKERFREYRLLPDRLPPFLHGFQMDNEVWVYEQPGPYYRRHLLLHEGTHAAMNRIYGRVGPAWYREGLAEMLGTHKLVKGVLTLASMPADKRDVEHWGRIKIVRDEVAKGKIRSIQSIVDARTREFLNVESYAWSWALQVFGHQHPKLSSVFADLDKEMYSSTYGVTRKFLGQYQDNRDELDAAWRLFLHQLDYGYDSTLEWQQEVMPRRELVGDRVESLEIDVAKAWQSTGIVVPANTDIDIAAGGRFQVAKDSKVWWCEPQGVTIVYYQKHPLGTLLATVVPIGDGAARGEAFAKPTAIGRRGKLSSESGGILYFRINERADKLRDNVGKVKIRVRRSQD